jgi:adenosylhomocysteine nucleosidase
MRRGTPAVRAFAAAVAVAGGLATACAPVASSRQPPPLAGAGTPRADIVIQGAVDAEVIPLVAALDGASSSQIASWTFWRGRMGDKDVVVSRTEVGPINTVAATTLAIQAFHPRLIINQGTAGATDPALRVLDIIVGEATVDYGGFSTNHADAGQGSDQARWRRMPHRLRFGGDERVALPVFPCDPDVAAIALALPHVHGRVIKGVIGSAFQFNQEVDRLLWIREKYDAVSEDMESAFAGGTALGFDTPFVAVRIISDSDFYAPGIQPEAARHGAEFVSRLVRQIPRSLLTRWDPPGGGGR